MRNRLFAFVLTVISFAVSTSLAWSACLLAPERADVGRIATVTSDVKGDWILYPPDAADLAKDSDGKTIYMVARKECELTVIFFGVEANKPVITQTQIKIGEEPSPSPSPTPSPSPATKLSEKERAAAEASVEAVLDGIEEGTIRTAAGARSVFKQTIMAKGQECNGRSCYLPQALKNLTDDWTERCDFTSVDTVKTSFEEFLKEVKNE